MREVLGTFRQLLPLLPAKAQRFIWTYIVVTSLLAILDIVALGLLAVSLGDLISNRPVAIPLIGTVHQSQYVWLLLAISLIIIGKAVLNVGVQWIATRRFSRFELAIGDQLFDAYIRAPWTERLKKNTAHLVRLADVGIANTTSGFLLPVISIPSLLLTSIAVFAVIVVAQPLTALVTIVYLGGVSAAMAFGLSRRTVEAGRVNRDYSFKVASLMTDMVSALKEITLRNKADEVARVVHRNRIHTTRARSNINFLGALPKFVLDAALIGGFVVVGGAAYIFSGLPAALGAIALFGVAGFRLAPALVGFQGILTTTTATSPSVRAVIADITESYGYIERAERIGHDPIVGEPRNLVLRNVSFTYPGSDVPALSGVNLDLPLGSTLGLVGSSGAGKSTLVDLLLGLLIPSGGSIELDGVPLESVLAAWRSRVGYVPQEVALFDGTIAQNVALSWESELEPDRVESALRRAQLWDVVQARPGGIHSQVGDRGMTLSGGQRQRLGVARALYSDPLVLVMDEATSALDTKTESDVVQAIRALRGEVTVVSVAHRLATIRDNDQVCFMSDGAITAQGSFEHVVASVPEFAVQARLAGLSTASAKGAA